MQGEEVARRPWQADRAGEDIEDYTRIVAADQALDGEVLPPTKIPRPVMSAADETALSERIRAEHEAGARALKEAVKHFRRCGEALLKVKADLGDGRFGHFLKTRAKLHPRQAQRFMLLAKEMAKLPAENATRVSRLSLRDALGELARTSSRVAKLRPESLDRALTDARRHPLKHALIVAANAERYQTATLAQVVGRSYPPACRT
jgi:hypothetical protein